jgi:signal transduction histidine kinase
MEAGTTELDSRRLLGARRSRPPNHAAEVHALAELAKELGRNPGNLCQRLTELVLPLCRADSVGVSLLDGDVWRWAGLAGLYASHRDGTMPRAASPASVCIDERRTLLLSCPERRFPALAGEPRFVETLLVPFGAQEPPIGAVWVAAHTSERRFDAEDERLVRSLSGYAAAGWQVWTLQEEMAAAVRRKDDVLAIVGHELRHPLAAIAAATALLDRLAGGRDGEFAHTLDVLGRQSRHLFRLADDLNDLSRIGHGKLELRLQRVELTRIVADSVHSALPQIERRRQWLLVSVPPGSVELQADPVRMVQILANLLDNAAKYTPDGGNIWLKAVVREGTLELSVRDNGVGIPADKLAVIFDAFAQITPAGGRTEGLGLGLALVERLVTLHGGTIHASSAGPDMGSEFTVRLPLDTRSH